MRSILLLCLFVWRGTSALPAEPSSIISPHQAQGPPIGRQNRDASTKSKLEPQPPSIEGIDIEFDLRTPAPPPLGSGPQPPSSPDPALLELFERNPSAFAALFNNIQKQNGIKMKRDIKNQQKQRRSPTYDQFLTAAVISGFDLRNRLYTMFAPEDGVFAQLNLSLPLLALKDKNCVAQIVRSHMVAGKIAIRDDNEQMAVSLQESPIFFTIKEANGAGVVRANVETDYGIVHIIDALIDRPTLMDVCPSLSHLKSDQSKGQLQHSINQRKVKDFDEFYLQESWNGNAISGLNDGPVHESVDRDVYEYSFAEDE